MCGAPKDKSASIARRQENQRQRDVADGRAKIDRTFEGFDSDFFGGVRDAYTQTYMPQLDEQMGDATSAITKQLAAAGLLSSSVADDRMRRLNKDYHRSRQMVGSRAVDASNAARASVDQNRATLYQQLEGGMAPGDAAAQATTLAAQARQTPTYSPLEALFTNLVNQGATTVAAEARGFPGTGLGLFQRGGSSRSSREIR